VRKPASVVAEGLGVKAAALFVARVWLWLRAQVLSGSKFLQQYLGSVPEAAAPGWVQQVCVRRRCGAAV